MCVRCCRRCVFIVCERKHGRRLRGEGLHILEAGGEDSRTLVSNRCIQHSVSSHQGQAGVHLLRWPSLRHRPPHYGHILAGTIKDIVTRYQSMTGHHVTRRFGWDCHGLPVENEIDKKLGIKKREDVLKLGIDKYNEECRSIVTRYVSEWESVITRTGRWIDFKNDYKTMDLKFMESVWWVFSQLYAKNLVYKGFKVMPYSTGCKTPLSNFEAGQNYKDVSDPEVFMTFPSWVICMVHLL
ncbi:hypothetical protein ACSQ67_026358 [Phaseolus vulgaris]